MTFPLNQVLLRYTHAHAYHAAVAARLALFAAFAASCCFPLLFAVAVCCAESACECESVCVCVPAWLLQLLLLLFL